MENNNDTLKDAMSNTKVTKIETNDEWGIFELVIGIVIGTIIVTIIGGTLVLFVASHSGDRKYFGEYKKHIIDINEDIETLCEGAILSYDEYIEYYKKFFGINELSESDMDNIYNDKLSKYLVISSCSSKQNIKVNLLDVKTNKFTNKVKVDLYETRSLSMDNGTAYMLVIPIDCKSNCKIDIEYFETQKDIFPDGDISIDKPVIYIYPEEETDLKVELNFNGKLGTTYPKYNNGWKVRAYPNGILLDESGRKYNYLFWEGTGKLDVELNEGFCIKGEDTQKFLEEKLTELGLTDKEQCDFITYWLPQMENNKYNVIKFLEEEYTNLAELKYSCNVDTEIRVYMYCVPSNKYVKLKKQKFEAPERKGFTVVEWGGTIVN